MTNGSKFVTVHERIEAFRKYCEKMHDRPGESCGKQEWCSTCSLKWLDLECEEEKPLPCPFCGAECVICQHDEYDVECAECGYVSALFESRELAIAAHNRLAKAAKESEVKE